MKLVCGFLLCALLGGCAYDFTGKDNVADWYEFQDRCRAAGGKPYWAKGNEPVCLQTVELQR